MTFTLPTAAVRRGLRRVYRVIFCFVLFGKGRFYFCSGWPSLYLNKLNLRQYICFRKDTTGIKRILEFSSGYSLLGVVRLSGVGTGQECPI